jgi:hypothetical protein
MISQIFRPKHTLLSVAREIENGLKNKSIYLSDNDIIDDGYEVFQYKSTGFFIWYEFLFATIINILVAFLSVSNEVFRLGKVVFPGYNNVASWAVIFLFVVNLIFLIILVTKNIYTLTVPHKKLRHISKKQT